MTSGAIHLHSTLILKYQHSMILKYQQSMTEDICMVAVGAVLDAIRRHSPTQHLATFESVSELSMSQLGLSWFKFLHYHKGLLYALRVKSPAQTGAMSNFCGPAMHALDTTAFSSAKQHFQAH